jgi:hemolysin-activating ACP:hemolysin acyltransferase
VIELSKEQWCDGALIVLLRVVCPLGASTQTATVP